MEEQNAPPPGGRGGCLVIIAIFFGLPLWFALREADDQGLLSPFLSDVSDFIRTF
jgi:hypothetical protein